MELKQNQTGYELRVPENSRDAIATVIKLTLDAPVSSIAPLEMPSISGSIAFQKPAKASWTSFKNKPHHAFDDNPFSHWTTGNGEEQWLEVDLENPQAVDSAAIHLNSTGILLSLQAEQNGEWQTVFCIEKATRLIETEFPPVMARKFRLLISSGKTDIIEFQLFSTEKKQKHRNNTR